MHKQPLFQYIIQGSDELDLSKIGYASYNYLIRLSLLLLIREDEFLFTIKEEFGKTKDDLLSNKISFEVSISPQLT